MIGHENTKTRNKPYCGCFALSCFRGDSPPACVAARLWPIAAFICLAVAPLRAQLSAGELRVSVVDATGLGLAAAGTLVSDGSQTDRRFETAADGTFTFDRLPFGIYRLTLSSPGFAPRSELIEVRSPRPREVRLMLDVAALSTSVDVTEQSTLVDAHRTGVAYGVGTQQLREQQSAVPGRELLDLVNLQPGWLVESNGVLHPRGSEYQTLVVVDGMPMEDNRSPAFAPELPDAEIEAIHVITGTFPAEYGRKLGGVIEVVTASSTRRGFGSSVSASLGSFDTRSGDAILEHGGEKRTISLTASASATDRYLDPPVSDNFTNHGSTASAAMRF